MRWTGLLLYLSVALCIRTAPLLSSEHRLLVMYSYYYATPASHLDEDNLVFFACTGVYYNDSRIQYRFLFAADDAVNAAAGFKHSPLYHTLPPEMFTATNVEIIWLTNGFYDLCTFKRAITDPWFLRLSTSISLFFFLNATVRGPFLPFYARHIPWWEPFTSLLVNTTSMVGPYLNCEVAPHIQTFAFLLDQEGLEIAKRTWFCPSSEVRHNEAARARWIAKTEVGLSRNLVAAGRSFSTLLASHSGVEGARLKGDGSCSLRNPTLYHNYFGTYPSPYEVIFFKCGGDINRAHAMPDHALSLLQLYTQAVVRTWTHKMARERFLNQKLSWALCSVPEPQRNASCSDSTWIITSDWQVTDHALVRSKVRVLGSLEVLEAATLTFDANLEEYLIAVDGNAALYGHLHITLRESGRLGTVALLWSKRKVSFYGLVTVEGIGPFTAEAKVECDGRCLVLHLAEVTPHSCTAALLLTAALLAIGLMCWRSRRRIRDWRHGSRHIITN